jgi:hypothetical protein
METDSKKKRGRPSTKWTDDAVVVNASLWPEVTTKRGRLNKLHMTHALKTLKGEDQSLFDYFQNQKPYPQGVLRRLGVIALKSPDDCVAIAKTIKDSGCDMKEAARIVRLILRKGKPDALRLANALIKTVNDYWKRFPELTEKQVDDAIHTMQSQVKQSFQK